MIRMSADSTTKDDVEFATPYELFLHNNPSHSYSVTDLLNMGYRVDGRLLYEHRKIVIRKNIISNAIGSAYIEQGNTKVLVAVYGPTEIFTNGENPRGSLYCDFKFAPASCPERMLLYQDMLENTYCQMLKKSLEPSICLDNISNYQYNIHAVVIHNDGSALSAAVNAAGIAVSSAGIPMYDSIICVSLIALDGSEALDPTFDEEISCLEGTESNHTYITMSYLQIREKITHFNHIGNLCPYVILQNIEKLIDFCRKMVPLANKVTEEESVNNLLEDMLLNEMINICENDENNNMFVEISDCSGTFEIIDSTEMDSDACDTLESYV